MTLGHQQHWYESQYEDHYGTFEPLTLNVQPSERAGAPLPNRAKARARRLLAAAVLIGGAWAAVASFGLDGVLASAKSLVEILVTNAKEIATRASEEREAIASAAASSAPGLAGQTAVGQDQEPATLPELTPSEAVPTAPAAEPQSTEAMGQAYAEKTEPTEDAVDTGPKRKSAIEAGLGPDLPNVLLSRLSKADLKNAAYAIKTALARTADDASFAWPPKPSRQQALFEVRFVEGAPQGCRRYIVTVTKERWASTSAALEKCGSTAAGKAS